MKNVIASLVAVAGVAAVANAQALVDLQVSTDGVNFSNAVDAVPGSTVVVRTRVSYNGGGAPIGLASFVYQPTVSNWDATGAGADADQLQAFLNGGAGGNTTNPSGVVNPADIGGLDGPWGRVSPWGRTALTTTSALKGHVHTGGSGGAPAGSWLRIAQTQVTGWIGGTGNTTGGSGVPIAQLSNVGRTTADPAFNDQLANVVVFQFAITLSNDGAARTLNVDAPVDGFGNRNTAGVREIYWWASLAESTGSIRGGAVVDGAAINVIPTPASMALLGLGGLMIGRRRR
jgi:uncharacterized protein (TIGR03382 family)